MKKLNAYQRIQAGMKRREDWLLWFIKEDGHYRPNEIGVCDVQTYNAIERLTKAGVIRYKKNVGYVLKAIK